MKEETLNDFEKALLRLIRNGSDPSRAMNIIMEILITIDAGESPENVITRYGDELKALLGRA